VSDDLKASSLGCYGNKICQTPHIDSIAKHGVVFERAYCQGTWCLPSRESFMFSKYRGRSARSLGECLQDQGVMSARVGKIFHMRVPGDIIDGTDGNDVSECWTQRFNSSGQEAHTPGDYACLNQNIFTTELANRQSTRMPHRMFVTVEIDGDGADQPDSKTASKAIELLEAHQDDSLFLAIGFVRPHYPMVAPRPYFDRYDPATLPLPHVPADDLDDIPPAGLRGTTNARNAIGQYPEQHPLKWQGNSASVSFTDDQVGRVLAKLAQLGIRDETAILFTSDHGYHLGEHTHWQKKNMHEEVTRVPLVISVPGLTGKHSHDVSNQRGSETNDSALRSKSLVELVDLYPTIVNLLGHDIPDDIDGKSLVPVLAKPTLQIRESAFSIDRVKQQWDYADRGSRYAYMRYADGSEELYDMQTDPGQFHNLVFVNDASAILKRVRERLNRKIAQTINSL
ncbi:MAG: sulfatase-like hydrolase/transferase, partial [Planctomycetota bacterium]